MVGAATLAEAARTAGLPAWPVTVLDVVSPDDPDAEDSHDPAGLVGWVPVRWAAAARRLDAARDVRRYTSCFTGSTPSAAPTAMPSSTSATPTI